MALSENKYHVELSRQASKFLSKLPTNYYRLISDHLLELQNDPFPPGCKKLKGTDDQYRLRAGTYRILYSVYHKKLIVHVIKIGHRKDVYE